MKVNSEYEDMMAPVVGLENPLDEKRLIGQNTLILEFKIDVALLTWQFILDRPSSQYTSKSTSKYQKTLHGCSGSSNSRYQECGAEKAPRSSILRPTHINVQALDSESHCNQGYTLVDGVCKLEPSDTPTRKLRRSQLAIQQSAKARVMSALETGLPKNGTKDSALCSDGMVACPTGKLRGLHEFECVDPRIVLWR
ncbi:hypothetical protein FRB99_004752 [Tulasnella sp. 403]|nr:hypothetical protein FRB99_004752 [Tulasnella sp. 403]